MKFLRLALLVLIPACAVIGGVLGAHGNDGRDEHFFLVGRFEAIEPIAVDSASRPISVVLLDRIELDTENQSLEPSGLEPYMLRAEDLPERFRPYFAGQGLDVGTGFCPALKRARVRGS